MALSRTEEIGRVLAGRYRIIAPIGRGASAQVFLADDVRLRRRVAVKMLHDALADDAAFLRRFQAEAQAAAALNHPNVMAVYDWGQDPDGDVPFLVLEYLAGGSLRSTLDRGDRLSPSQALLVGLEATRALEYAHRRGFVHRDIKPANLLFGEEGRLRIADFGLARALAEAAWTEPQGAVLGTARYASPEQAQGRALTGKADVYSLALVLVEAVTGRVPFTADTTIGTLMARVDRDLEVDDALGPLRSALERAGRADPEARLDAHDLAVSLMAAAGGMPRPAPLPLAGAVDLDGAVDADPTMLGGSSGTTAVVPAPADAPAEPLTTADDDDLEVWPFLNVTEAGAATVPVDDVVDDAVDDADDPGAPDEPQEVDLDLTMTEAVDPEPATAVAAAPRPSFAATAATSAAPPAAPVPPTPGAADAAPDYVQASPPRRRRSWRRWALIGFVLVLLVAVGVSAGALVADLTATPTHDVPDVVGLDVDAAREKLAANKWEISERHIRRDGTDPGQVLEVDPAVGESVREGEKVLLVVSDGNEIAAVPAGLAGKPVADATSALEKAGFKVTTTEAFHEDVPAGAVIALAEGTKPRLPKGETVGLVVSKGPPPRTIPDGLAGKSEGEVVGALTQLKLAPKASRPYDPEVPKGAVIRTEPGAGTEVPRGSVVTVVVSKGPQPIELPDVSNTETVDGAINLLESKGFTIGEVRGNGAQPFRTDPPAGTLLPPGSTVDLILRKRP